MKNGSAYVRQLCLLRDLFVRQAVRVRAADVLSAADGLGATSPRPPLVLHLPVMVCRLSVLAAIPLFVAAYVLAMYAVIGTDSTAQML